MQSSVDMYNTFIHAVETANTGSTSQVDELSSSTTSFEFRSAFGCWACQNVFGTTTKNATLQMPVWQVLSRLARAAQVAATLLLPRDDEDLCDFILDRLVARILVDLHKGYSKSRQQQWALCYAALCEKVMGGTGAKPRISDDIRLWKSMLALSSGLAMLQILEPDGRRSNHLPRRLLPFEVHRAVEGAAWNDPAWSKHLDLVMADAWSTAKPTLSAAYTIVHRRSRLWYVGRTQAVRPRGKHVWPGSMLRFKEHFVQAMGVRKKDEEYRHHAWRRSAPHELQFVVWQRGPDAQIRQLETAAIRALHQDGKPPTNTSTIITAE